MEEVQSLYPDMIPLCSRNSTVRRMRLTNPSSESCCSRRSFLPALSLNSPLQSLYSKTKKVWKQHCRHSSRSILSSGSPSSNSNVLPPPGPTGLAQWHNRKRWDSCRRALMKTELCKRQLWAVHGSPTHNPSCIELRKIDYYMNLDSSVFIGWIDHCFPVPQIVFVSYSVSCHSATCDESNSNSRPFTLRLLSIKILHMLRRT